jgi:hypothetical protein
MQKKAQDDYFTRSIVGNNLHARLGVSSGIRGLRGARQMRQVKLSRKAWLKDPDRVKLSRNLRLPSSFASFEDKVAYETNPQYTHWIVAGAIGLILIGLGWWLL